MNVCRNVITINTQTKIKQNSPINMNIADNAWIAAYADTIVSEPLATP